MGHLTALIVSSVVALLPPASVLAWTRLKIVWAIHASTTHRRPHGRYTRRGRRPPLRQRNRAGHQRQRRGESDHVFV